MKLNLKKAQFTIKQRLFLLTACGLMFVAAVSITGYWQIQLLAKAALQAEATGSAVRSHVEAGVFNDMTRDDISTLLMKKGDEQQSISDNLALHSKMLSDRIAGAQSFAIDPSVKSALDEESRMVGEYVSATADLSQKAAHNPAGALEQLNSCLQLYRKLQEEIGDTEDLMEKAEKDAQAGSASKATRARRAMLALCGSSLLLLLLMASWGTLSISRPLEVFSRRFEAMAEANDLTARVDQERQDEIGQLGRCLNSFVEKVQDMLIEIARSAEQVASASAKLNATSLQITANSQETSAQAKLVSDATVHVSENLQTVASGAGEMGISIQEIAKNATEAAWVATSAVRVAEATTVTISKLGDSSSEIGQVIKVITTIAKQTNLLALNATIEAARAGDAGKGFAVVANEVKELAEETSKATEDISRKIEAIQTDTKAAVQAIASISGVINQINEISTSIATAVEEQNATTNAMSRNVSQAAQGSSEITSNIAGVAAAAANTSRGAADTQKATQQLVETSAELRRLVEQFKMAAAEGIGATTLESEAHRRAAHA
jgi:methyl-accepting chemotaxis protein